MEQPAIPVFWLEPTDRARLSLRRYCTKEGEKCEKSGFTYHNASVEIGEAPCVFHVDEHGDKYIEEINDSVPRDDPRWPKACVCGYVFDESARWQVNQELIYRTADGREFTLRDAPIGAMWNAWWLARHDPWKGPDGMALMVRIPNGERPHDWCVDGVARNCPQPKDHTHKCWIRHGDPRDPQGLKTGQPLHVDKNGKTCAAGAGSIAPDNWHGFLHNGHLRKC